MKKAKKALPRLAELHRHCDPAQYCRKCKGRGILHTPVHNGDRYQLVTQPCDQCQTK